jgi:predicted transcriptional regulator
MWMLRGASDIQGFPDSIAIFLPGADSSDVKVVHTKMRNAEKLQSFHLNLQIEDDLGRARIGYREVDAATENDTRQQIAAILRNGGMPVTSEQVAAATGLSLKTVVDHMKVLTAIGEVESRKEGGMWWHQIAMR